MIPRSARVTVISYSMTAASTLQKAEVLAEHCQLSLIVPSEWPWYAPEQAPLPTGLEVHKSPVVLAGRHHFYAYRSIGPLIRSLRPDLVYYDQEPWSISTQQIIGAAQSVDARICGFTWQNINKRYPPPFSWFERRAFNATHGIIAGNAEAADLLRTRGYRGVVTHIPQFGVDPRLFVPAQRTAEEPRDSERIRVGYVGRLVPEKGVVDLLEAVARTAHVELVYAGVGPLRGALEERAAQLRVTERVRFLGGFPSTAIASVLADIDVLALPSRTTAAWKEQFGRILIEAMACGVPVIGSDSAEIPNVIGDAGLIVPEGNVDALVRAIDDLKDPALRIALRERGLDRVTSHFTHRRIAERTLAMWAQLLSG